MSDRDCLEAFQRYCHPKVVKEFHEVGAENQRVWLDAFLATCCRRVKKQMESCLVERMMSANPNAKGPEDVDVNAIFSQMRSSTRSSAGQADLCPLLRAMKPEIKTDQRLWEDLLEDLRQDFLKTWGRISSRQELEERHQMGLLSQKFLQQSLRQNSDLAAVRGSDATTQKPMATVKSWSSLVPSAFVDLPVFMVAKGKVVHCKVIAEPFVTVALQLLVEDSQGQVMPLQLYNQFPDGSHAVISKFAKGTKLSIAEPFLKIMNDGYRGIRIDAPTDLRLSSQMLDDNDMMSLKTSGNSAFSKGQFDLAKERYMAALQLGEVEEIARFLANRAQAFLDIDPLEACKDAAATLLLRPEHAKAGLRYAIALKKCAENLAEGGEELRGSLLLVAKRAANLYPARAEAQQSVTRKDVQNVLAIFLSGFEDGLKFYQNRIDFQSFGETAAQCREEANHQYKAGNKLNAIAGYTLGLVKVSCTNTVATVLSNLSEVCLKQRESHNAISFALAATRFGVPELLGKLLSRTCRALDQLGQRSLAVQLADSVSENSAYKQFSHFPDPIESLKTRVYTNGMAEVLVDETLSKSTFLPEMVHQHLKTVLVQGKGRGVIATESMEAGEVLTVSYALSLCLAEKDDATDISSGRIHWKVSTAKLISTFAYCASKDNEVAWVLSQLCEKPGQHKETVQPGELIGLSARWMPLLGQQHCYYPPCDRVFLAKPSIDAVVLINSHGSHKAGTGPDHSGVFPSACLFNHSSDANCAFAPVKFRDGPKVREILVVMTIRAVKKGEELCVCYSEDMPAENQWGIAE